MFAKLERATRTMANTKPSNKEQNDRNHNIICRVQERSLSLARSLNYLRWSKILIRTTTWNFTDWYVITRHCVANKKKVIFLFWIIMNLHIHHAALQIKCAANKKDHSRWLRIWLISLDLNYCYEMQLAGASVSNGHLKNSTAVANNQSMRF